MASSAEDPRIELVRRGFAAYERGDLESVFEVFDREIEVYAPPDVGNPGTYHGLDGFLEWAGRWNEAWDEFRQEIVAVEPIGERHVVADVHQTARGRASGVELEQTASYLYEVRDGRAVYLSMRFDPDEARGAAMARERERDG